MDDFTALLKLSEGNLTFTEAYWILKYLRGEYRSFVSKKSTKLSPIDPRPIRVTILYDLPFF